MLVVELTAGRLPTQGEASKETVSVKAPKSFVNTERGKGILRIMKTFQAVYRITLYFGIITQGKEVEEILRSSPSEKENQIY